MIVAALLAISWHAGGAMARCSASYTINLTVELSPELTNNEKDILIELRQGTPGHSKPANRKHFSGHAGIVSFSGMCAGSYFIAIGNGDTVAVGPVHAFSDNQNLHSTIRVTLSQGNIGTMSRGNL